ncbi:MAG TPA: hypothetical protein VKF41_12435 [Bryobacteraceae bacterium]|nr:hypothetical protein [Bryobacteraceae bacterium]
MFCRLLVAAAWLAVSAVAAPPLSTIQDVLYKADGARFNGTLTIAWKSFQPADNTAIVASGSTVVTVTNGYLHVQLVPSTTAIPVATYNVTYTSNGRAQFREVWAVPATSQILKVHDVRISSAAASSASGAVSADTGDPTTPLPESQVIGLIADLGARPVKGPNFASGSVAMVDGSGMLAAVSGNPADCVHVDGSSGSCGWSTASFMDGDTLSGLVDGTNTTFGLTAAPTPSTSLAVYRNGVLQKATQDYTLSGSTVTFLTASTPQPGDTLLASYRVPASDPTPTTTLTGPQVLCSGTGATTSSTTLTAIGSCTVASGVLLAGDRVQILFDLAHQNSNGGFSLEVHWGATTVVHRDATSTETLVTGRVDASILASGAQTSSQTWGTVLSLGATAGIASDSYASGLTITLQGLVGQAADSLTANNFTVVRIP